MSICRSVALRAVFVTAALLFFTCPSQGFPVSVSRGLALVTRHCQILMRSSGPGMKLEGPDDPSHLHHLSSTSATPAPNVMMIFVQTEQSVTAKGLSPSRSSLQRRKRRTSHSKTSSEKHSRCWRKREKKQRGRIWSTKAKVRNSRSLITIFLPTTGIPSKTLVLHISVALGCGWSSYVGVQSGALEK